MKYISDFDGSTHEVGGKSSFEDLLKTVLDARDANPGFDNYRILQVSRPQGNNLPLEVRVHGKRVGTVDEFPVDTPHVCRFDDTLGVRVLEALLNTGLITSLFSPAEFDYLKSILPAVDTDMIVLPTPDSASDELYDGARWIFLAGESMNTYGKVRTQHDLMSTGGPLPREIIDGNEDWHVTKGMRGFLIYDQMVKSWDRKSTPEYIQKKALDKRSDRLFDSLDMTYRHATGGGEYWLKVDTTKFELDAGTGRYVCTIDPEGFDRTLKSHLPTRIFIDPTTLTCSAEGKTDAKSVVMVKHQPTRAVVTTWIEHIQGNLNFKQLQQPE